MHQVRITEFELQAKYSKKLEKAEAKLLKNQHKLIRDIDNIELVSKRLHKQIKYRAKIQKYRLKLAEQVRNQQITLPITTGAPAAPQAATGLPLTVDASRPFKAKPCQSCPALKQGRCRCAIKASGTSKHSVN
ncbi:hypothetical protein [uncultured Shewanella sp.]|uniref:hypothetical protein n=1 Tax=Shewanella atlantica TaxID=271099 RepID=UPI0026204D92|nr:hypothetical protein [uncultured Shewanella sp.]